MKYLLTGWVVVWSVGLGWAAETIAHIHDRQINEISGMVSATTHDGWWVHNDSGDDPVLYAIAHDGTTLGRVRVADARARDWEDLAAYEHAGQRYLVIGDIGDNPGKRRSVQCYAIHEPQAVANETVTAEVVWQVDLTYPDGPRDAESLAIDTHHQQLLILSKRTLPASLYAAPLPTEAEVTLKAEKLVDWPIPEIPLALRAEMGPRGAVAHQPTAMDLGTAHQGLVIATYRQAFVYPYDGTNTWSQVFASDPTVIELPVLPQIESICWDRQGQQLWLSSEKIPAPLISILLPPVDAD